MEDNFDKTFEWFDKTFGLERGESVLIVKESLEEMQGSEEKEIKDDAGEKKDRIERAGKVIFTGLKISSAFFIGVFLSLIYAFLLILYRNSVRQFFLVQFPSEVRGKARNYIRDIQAISRQYIYGIVSVILIVGILNSVGLWIIGLEYALFFGFIAALLAIIPYVGTIVGAALPFAYALATSQEWWQPVSVAILFIMVQMIEGNFITPKVAGNSVSLNPLVSIFFFFAGGFIWGMAGMVLSLPVLAIFRATCCYIPVLKPVSYLLGNDLSNQDHVLEEQFDEEKYRLWTFFSRAERD